MIQNDILKVLSGILTGIILAGLIALVVVFCLFFDTKTNSEIDDSYYINSYNTQVSVLDNNSATVTERIEIRFNEVRELTLTRALPTVVSNPYSDDGKSYRLNYELTRVNYDYTKSYENGNLVIKMASPDTVVATGTPYIFSINYTVYFPNDRNAEFDDFFYNIIDSSWNTTVSNVTMSFTFQRDVSEYVNSNDYGAKVMTVADGEVVTLKPTLNSNNRQLVYTYVGTLDAFTPLTFSLLLPNGYFVTNTTDIWGVVALVVGILAVLLVFIIFFATRTKKIKKVKESFVEPKGINPLELAYLLRQEIKGNDFADVLIYFAQNGNISISRAESGKIYIEKILAPQNLIKNYENTVFDTIFKSGDRVELDDAKEALVQNFVKIRNEVGKSGDYSNYSKKALGGLLSIAIISILALFVVMALTVAALGFVSSFNMVAFFIAAILCGIALLLNRFVKLRYFLSSKTFILCYSIMLAILCGGLIVVLVLMYDTFSLCYIGLLIAAISVILASVLPLFTGLFSERGTIMASRFLSFKKFVKFADIKQIGEILEKDKTAVIKIYPFADVLGVGADWLEKCRIASGEFPEWFNDASSKSVGVNSRSENN